MLRAISSAGSRDAFSGWLPVLKVLAVTDVLAVTEVLALTEVLVWVTEIVDGAGLEGAEGFKKVSTATQAETIPVNAPITPMMMLNLRYFGSMMVCRASLKSVTWSH